MAQINQRQPRQESDDPITLLMKGLTVASQVYGIKANMQQLEDAKAKNDVDTTERNRVASERERIAGGNYNANEMVELSKTHKFSPTQVEGGQQINPGGAGPVWAYVEKSKPAAPQFDKVTDVQKDGKIGTILRNSSTGEETFYAGAPKEVKQKETSPLLRSVVGLKDGVSGTFVKDYSTGKPVEVDFIPEKTPLAKSIGKVFGATPMEGFTPTTQDAEKIKVARDARDGIAAGMARLDDLYKTNGTELVGDNATEMEGIVTGMQLNLKELQNLGVLNGPDLALLQRQIPDPSSLAENAKGFTGQDRYVAKRDTFVNALEDKFESGLRARGFQRTDERLGKYKTKEEGTAIAAVPPKPTPEDLNMIESLRKNPNDPRNESIKQILKAKGLKGL